MSLYEGQDSNWYKTLMIIFFLLITQVWKKPVHIWQIKDFDLTQTDLKSWSWWLYFLITQSSEKNLYLTDFVLTHTSFVPPQPFFFSVKYLKRYSPLLNPEKSINWMVHWTRHTNFSLYCELCDSQFTIPWKIGMPSKCAISSQLLAFSSSSNLLKDNVKNGHKTVESSSSCECKTTVLLKSLCACKITGQSLISIVKFQNQLLSYRIMHTS